MYFILSGTLFSFCLCFGSSWANPLELQLSSEPALPKEICNICQELKKEYNAGDSDSLKEQMEVDKKDVREALKDISNNLNEINEKIWWVPRSDIAQVHNESQMVRDAVLKKSLALKEIETKTGALRTKVDVYEAEKETNKAKAVEQWAMLLVSRKRLHNIEKIFLDVVILAEDLATVAHMDRLRVFANSIAEKLKEVVDYYENNTAAVQTIHTSLHEIAVKKVELQTKNMGHNKKKCAFLFFFCD